MDEFVLPFNYIKGEAMAEQVTLKDLAARRKALEQEYAERLGEPPAPKEGE